MNVVNMTPQPKKVTCVIGPALLSVETLETKFHRAPCAGRKTGPISPGPKKQGSAQRFHGCQVAHDPGNISSRESLKTIGGLRFAGSLRGGVSSMGTGRFGGAMTAMTNDGHTGVGGRCSRGLKPLGRLVDLNGVHAVEVRRVRSRILQLRENSKKYYITLYIPRLCCLCCGYHCVQIATSQPSIKLTSFRVHLFVPVYSSHRA